MTTSRWLARTGCIASITLLGLLGASGCAGAEDVEDETSAESADELRSAPLATSDMRRVAQPAGMPKPWDQPDSTGVFDERGKCGPTAVANTLRLYWIDVSPQEADRAGVHWVVGTMGRQIERYLDEHHPELGCSLEHPQDGAAFLRKKLAAGHPVMVWFNTSGSWSSHWVTAVGVVGKGADEDVIVMSWGRYYAIKMTKLVSAWRNVYGIRNPAVVCDERTQLLRR